MKAGKQWRDRHAQLKNLENDLQAAVRTRQYKPSSAFQTSVDENNNEQELEELSDLLYSTRQLIIKFESTFEVD